MIGDVSQVDESRLAFFTFPGPIDALSYSAFRAESRNEYTIVGGAGLITVRPAYNAEGLVQIQIQSAGQPATITVECPNNYTLEIEQFGRCILNGEEPAVNAESSLRTARIMDAVLELIGNQLNSSGYFPPSLNWPISSKRCKTRSAPRSLAAPGRLATAWPPTRICRSLPNASRIRLINLRVTTRL